VPTLDQKGHIPEPVLYSHEEWTDAARECGVPSPHVGECYATVENLHNLCLAAEEALSEYCVALGCELEMLPWGSRDRVIVAAGAAADRVAEFMAAAREARALIEGGNR
jgi:hypothetical protein